MEAEVLSLEFLEVGHQELFADVLIPHLKAAGLPPTVVELFVDSEDWYAQDGVINKPPEVLAEKGLLLLSAATEIIYVEVESQYMEVLPAQEHFHQPVQRNKILLYKWR